MIPERIQEPDPCQSAAFLAALKVEIRLAIGSTAGSAAAVHRDPGSKSFTADDARRTITATC